MDNLPPELLFSIFTEVDFSEYSPNSLINVASVCRRWRDVVYSQPSLWTALTIPAHIAPLHEHGASQDQALLSYMKRFFSHSGDLPLALDLKATTSVIAAPNEGAIPDFLVRTSRLKTLSIETSPQSRLHGPWFSLFLGAAHKLSKRQGNPCWKSMQCLKFKSRTTILRRCIVLPLFEVAPSLQRLELAFHYVTDVAFVRGLVVKSEALRHIHIDSHFRCSNAEKAAFILQIIRSLPQLSSLTIHGRDDLDSPILELEVLSLVPILPVHNLNLSHLDLWDSRATRWALCNIVLPALESLRLYRDYPTTLTFDVNLGEVIRGLVQRSSCALKGLRLEPASPIAENLLEALRDLPTLEAIELRCGCATAGAGDRIQSLQFLHELSTTAGAFSLKSCPTDLLPSLKEFIYHDDLLDVKYIPDLIVHFKSFVEHPSRRSESDQATTVEAEFPAPRVGRPPVIWRKWRPGITASGSAGLPDSVDETFKDKKEYVSLKKAVLYAGGYTNPPVYSRTVEPRFMGPQQAAPASAERLNDLTTAQLKSLMKDCEVTVMCSRPKKRDLIDAILTALHPPCNAQVDSITEP